MIKPRMSRQKFGNGTPTAIRLAATKPGVRLRVIKMETAFGTDM